MYKKKLGLLVFFVWIFNLCFFCFPQNSQAAGATLFLSPASGTYAVGKTFNVKVLVNSGGDPGINTAEASLSYDASMLKATRVSKDASIFMLWTKEPSASGGSIAFGGGSPTPYTGSAGTIMSITFTALKAGTTEVKFNSGMVLEYGPTGKNIFSGFGHAKFTIEEEKKEEKPVEKKEEVKKEEIKEPIKKEEKKEETTSKGILPPLPEISSETHTDSNIWYSNNNPAFSWKLLSDLTGISYILDKVKDTNPAVVLEGVTESIKLENIEDGEWYFHIKYKNKSGWGEVAHKKIMIDASAPIEFNVKIDDEGDTTNPSPKIKFSTKDEVSGLDYYQVNLNGKKTKLSLEDLKEEYYKPNALEPGEYNVEVLASDMAGNGATSSAKFIVDALRAPIITSISKTLVKGEEFIIQGSSFYPDAKIKIFIAEEDKDPQEFEAKTDEKGNWSYFHRKTLNAGAYEVWAKLFDNRGAQSLESNKNIITITSASIIDSYGIFIISFLIILILFLVTYIYYIVHKFRNERRRIKSETAEVKRKLSKIFSALREEVDELIELADKKKGLSESERRVKDKLQESLDISEEFITKEVDDVEKEISLSEEKKF